MSFDAPASGMKNAGNPALFFLHDGLGAGADLRQRMRGSIAHIFIYILQRLDGGGETIGKMLGILSRQKALLRRH